MKIAWAAVILSTTLTAQDANPLSADVKRAYTDVKNNILRSAEKMPEENYDFRPAPRVRTFGQIIGHTAQERYLYFCAPVKGEQKSVDIERTRTTKTDLIAALKDSFAYCDSVYDKMTDAEATSIVNTGGSRSTKLRLLWMNIVHDESHYGNLITYLRMKGIVPPSTEASERCCACSTLYLEKREEGKNFMKRNLNRWVLAGALTIGIGGATLLADDAKDYSKTKQYQQGVREGKDDHVHNKDHSRKRHFNKDEDQKAYEQGYRKGFVVEVKIP